MRYLILLIIGLSFNAFASQTDEPLNPKVMNWQFEGVLGTFDRQSAQRGFKVYKEVCSACHGLKRIAFRNLQELGFSEAEIKSLASTYIVKDGPNEDGEMFDRPARLYDRILGPYSNDNSARAANNGALPPDLSLIIKAREHGPNYIYSLLTGYSKPPEGFILGPNMYYNPYFSGGGSQLAMPPPLTKDGQVEFSDGTVATIDQMALDVVNFLEWAAEPELEHRKSLGIKVLLFVFVFTVIFYLAYRKIWRNVH